MSATTLTPAEADALLERFKAAAPGSLRRLVGDLCAEVTRLEERNRRLEAACEAVIQACDTAPPVRLIEYLSKAVEEARAAVAVAKAAGGDANG